MVVIAGTVWAGHVVVASASTPPPTPSEPGVITVSSLSSTSADLAWGGSKALLGIEGYRVYRQLAGGPEEMIATTDAITSYDAEDLRSGAHYTFGITAIDVANNESPMQTLAVTTPSSSDGTVPAAPSNASLSIKPFSSTRLDIVWGNSSSSNVSYFEVYRGQGGGPQTVVATVDLPNAPRYSDNGLSPSTTYSYSVDAVSSNGILSPQTVIKSGTTLAPGAVIIPRGPVVSDVTGTSAVISWWTNIPTSGTLAIGGQSIVDTSGSTQHHEVAVSGLAAGSTVPYTVSSGTASATGSVTTAALPGQTFSFAAIGDYGGGGPGEVNNAANVGTAGTQFIQTLGDNIYPSAGLPDPDFSTTYSDFDAHFYKELGPDVNSQAFFPANGNKEYYSNGQFWVNFPMPGANHEWYSYNWGNAHVLVLDSEQPMGPGSAQYSFAQADLAANQSESWRIVALQRPPYSSTTDKSSSKFAQALIPLFQGYRVNLVLSGNSHNYERSYPLTNGTEDTVDGITYIVSGGGGSGFNKFNDTTFPEPPWSAFRESDYWEFAKITVSPTSIQENAVRADTDTVFDSTTINPFPADATAPSSPTGVAAVSSTSGTITVTWTANPVTDGVTGYDLYRNGMKIGSTTGTVTSFPDSGLLPSTSYSYRVAAVDGAGNESSPSSTASATTGSAPPSTSPIPPGAPSPPVATQSDCVTHLPSDSVVGATALANGSGYFEVDSAGDVATFGAAACYGALTGAQLNKPIVGMAADAATGGYWLVASDGGIFSFNAPFYGSAGGIHLNQPIVGLSGDRSGTGYWLVASDGGIFAFGTAPFEGSTGSLHLNQPIVGMAVDQASGGYWLVASDGGIFSFGGARFLGSTGSFHLNQPIVGMAPLANGDGYRLFASDGGVFDFNSPFYGSTGDIRLNRPIVGGLDDASGNGYWLIASDGGVFSFHAPFLGSAA